jgi:hypothetical protein
MELMVGNPGWEQGQPWRKEEKIMVSNPPHGGSVECRFIKYGEKMVRYPGWEQGSI